MFLENITFAVAKPYSGAFETWIKSEILFLEDWVDGVHTYKLLTEIDPESNNYSIQFIFISEEQFQVFKQLHFDLLINKAHQKFSGQILHFNTLLQKF